MFESIRMIRHIWRFSIRFFVVHFVAKWYILQQHVC